jgi:hypothetical protein
VTLPLELLCCIKGCPKKAGVLKTIKETLLELPNGLIIHTRAAYKNRSDIKKDICCRVEGVYFSTFKNIFGLDIFDLSFPPECWRTHGR